MRTEPKREAKPGGWTIEVEVDGEWIGRETVIGCRSFKAAQDRAWTIGCEEGRAIRLVRAKG